MKPRKQKRDVWSAYSWTPLSKPVRLLPNGCGPLIVGVSADAPLGVHMLKELEKRAKNLPPTKEQQHGS